MLATPSQQNTREPRKELPMLKIEAVVRPERTSTVLEALTAAGGQGLLILETSLVRVNKKA